MKTNTLNLKKILSIFVLILVCSSMFMFVGCSNEGEVLTWTNKDAAPTFKYNTGWEDPTCTEYSNGQESLEDAYETFFKAINLSYTAKEGATAQTGTLFDFRKKGASISNLVIKTATAEGETRTMTVTYNGVSCKVDYKVTVTQGTAKS